MQTVLVGGTVVIPGFRSATTLQLGLAWIGFQFETPKYLTHTIQVQCILYMLCSPVAVAPPYNFSFLLPPNLESNS